MAARAEPKVVILCLLGALLGGAACVVGARGIVAQRHLQREGVRIEARVTDARSGRQYGGGSHEFFELKYEFTVPGRSEIFTLEDEVGRSDLWQSMDDQSQWQAALDAGVVSVLYWPPNPKVNRVIRRFGNPTGDAGAAVIIGFIVALTGLSIGWLEVTGRGDHWRQVWKQIRNPKG